MPGLRRILVLAAALALSGCDRNLEPFDPNEEPHQPDLSRIFPAGAERVGRAEPGLPEAPGGRGAQPVAATEAGEPIHGTLRIAPELANRIPTGAVLFLIARNPQGGPPLAVKRFAAPSFPLDFEIGPADRMIETLPFAGSMALTARIDADGNATSRNPGDLLGSTRAPVEPGARGVELVIDQVQPAEGSGEAASAPLAAAAGASGAPIRGTVRIAAELASQIPQGYVLFVIARRGESGPPLAVKRIESPRFPLDFELGPADRMIQSLAFTGPLTVSARLDADGNAMSRSPGDLFGAAATPVDPGAVQIDLLIDRTVTSEPEG